MRKLFILSCASILLLTGCGATETLSCEYRDTTNDMATRIHYDIDHQNETVKKVRITYNYDFTNNANGNNGTARDTTNNNGMTTHTDGVGTGTDGTTNDTNIDDDGIVDGVVGSVIDTIVGGVTGIILDSAGLRDRHATVQNTYGNVNGFSVQNTNDTNDNYTVTYVIDYDTISDTDLNTFNLSRDLDQMRNTYVNQGFTCR
jgi:hypothetical protein